ncbi:hypothetical protein Q4I30_001365 [Leishmania utingensis]|uniref:Uncharacterized protein n=1 Tax=Leishmania utingensis TaxID=653362 RepID=A0AAW3AVK5_9TRYP
MSAPFLAQGERRPSSAYNTNPTALRDALCSRIRTLGAAILAITQAAMKEVEDLDANSAEQQHCFAKQPPRCESSPHVGKVVAKALRPQRVSQQTSGGESGSSPATPGCPTSSGPQTPPKDRSPSSSLGSSSNTKEKQHRNQRSPTLGVGEDSSTSMRREKSSERIIKEVENSTEEDASGCTLAHLRQSDAAVMTLCAAAEANFLRVLAKRPPHNQQFLQSAFTSETSDTVAAGRDDDCEEDGQLRALQHWGRGAPLYDLSNAAITTQYHRCMIAAEASKDTDDDGALPYSTFSDAKEREDGGLASPVITAGGAVPLSARAPVAASPLSLQVERRALDALRVVRDRRTGAASAAASNSTTPHAEEDGCTLRKHETSSPFALAPERSYYNVVYIHQLTPRTESTISGGGGGGSDADVASVSGQDNDVACALRRRPTSRALSDGAICSAAGDKAGEAPLTITSYVQAMYAVERVDAAPWRSLPDPDAQVMPLMASTPALMSGDAELVQLKLRVPAQCSCSNGSPILKAASPIEASTKPTDVKDPSSLIVDRLSEAATDVSVAAQHSDGTAAAALATAAETLIATRIKSIEDWRRDGLADVEEHIRRQRRSSVVSGGSQGVYYYFYPNSQGATAAVDGAATPTSIPESSPIHAERSATLIPQQPQEHQNLQTFPPSCVLASLSSTDKAATRAALLQTRRQPSTLLRSSKKAMTGAVTTLSCDSDSDRVPTRQPAELSHRTSSRSAVTEITTPTSAATAGSGGRSATVAATLTPSSESGPYWRLLLVVANAYNSAQCALGFAPRPASTAMLHPAEGDALLLSAPSLWSAHQKRKQAWEAEDRSHACTQQAHGLDIHAPIDIRIT